MEPFMSGDARRLLGGYATGTLTEAERKELYEAALHDPQLFEALADEDVLRQVLEDSTARAQVLRATESPRFTLHGALLEWFSRPKRKLLASLAAALVVAVCVKALMEIRTGTNRQGEPNLIAQAPPAAPSAVRPDRVLELPEQTAAKMPGPPSTRRAKGRSAANSTAAAPPPAAAPTAQSMADAPPQQRDVAQTAVAGDLRLRYTLLLQASGAAPQPVPPQYQFSDSDQVLIRFESEQSGWLVAQNPAGVNAVVQQIGPDQPVVYRVKAPAGETSRVVEVMLSRSAPTVTQTRAFRAYSDTAARFQVPERAQGTSAVVSPSTPPDTLALRIVIDRKKD
jgi:hypothetical protein